jgi:regulator of RNase E activity RraB
MSLSALLVLGLLGAWLMYRGHRGEAAVRDVDLATLEELTRVGSDLTQRHEVEFYLYCPTQEQAAAVAEELGREGYGIRLDHSSTEGDWLCLATRHMVPTLTELRELRVRFVALAERHGGAYDGWGATVVERPGAA